MHDGAFAFNPLADEETHLGRATAAQELIKVCLNFVVQMQLRFLHPPVGY